LDLSLRSVHYNELIAAKLVHVKNEDYDNLNYFIVGLFQETQRSTFNDSLPQDQDLEEEAVEEQASIKQAVCMFSLKDIQNKIKENLRRCYDAGQQAADSNIMRGLSFIKPDQRCNTGRNRNLFQQQRDSKSSGSSSSSSDDYSQIGDDFCSSADNGLYPIGGHIPAESNALLEFDGVDPEKLYFDSLDVWSDPIATTFLLKSSKRLELKYYHFKGFQERPVNYRTINLASAAKPFPQTKTRISQVNSLQF
jgi:hypothetical protein